MTWQKLPKPSTFWEEGEKWFELEDNLTEGKFDFLEYKEEPLPRGIILQRDVSVAMGPETLGTPGDLSRIWVAFTDQETGEIYLARSDADWNQWEEYLRIIYAPSGSYQPSLTFGQDGWHRMAVTLVPAGEEIPEVWIIEPPYSGDGIRRIGFGQNSRLGRDVYGEVFLFYQTVDQKQILYRKSSNNFTVDYLFESSEDKELQPRGFRVVTEQLSPSRQKYIHLMFYQKGEGALPLYKMTSPTYSIDFFRVKQTYPLYTNFGYPFIEWESIKYVDLLAKAGGLHTSFGELGLEWEEMRTGIFLLVYEGYILSDVLNEGFESQEINPFFGVTQGSSYGWVISDEDSFDGSYSLVSNNKGVSRGIAEITLSFDLQLQSDISFDYRVSSERNYDKFYVYLDGVAVIDGESGDLGWQTFETLIPAGSHTLRFRYAKDSSYNRYDDRIYVDNIKVTYYNPIPVPNATVQLEGQIVQTDLEGKAEFFDLDGNKLYDYEISHPDFEGVSKGTILIPEDKRDFIPVRIYNNSWDGMIMGRGIQPFLGDVSTLWHQVTMEEIQAKASGVKTNASLQSILWVEVESE